MQFESEYQRTKETLGDVLEKGSILEEQKADVQLKIAEA